MDKTKEVGTRIGEKVHLLNLMQWNLWIHEHMKKSHSYLFVQFLVPIPSFLILLGLIFYAKNFKCSISHNYLLYAIVIVFISINGGPIGWEKIPSPPNTHGQFCRKIIFWYNWLLKFYITRFFPNFLIKLFFMLVLKGMLRGPIGWERITSLSNTHGTLYSNASLSNIELLKLHIHTCIFNFWIPFHPIQKIRVQFVVSKKYYFSPCQSAATIKQMPHGFFLKFQPNQPWVFHVYNCCCVNNFQCRAKWVKKITSHANIHSRFCKIGIVWNINFLKNIWLIL
jgi:hypothetical protein